MQLKNQYFIDNVIAVQSGDYIYIVQGKRLTPKKLEELVLIQSKHLQKIGIIEDYKCMNIIPVVNHTREFHTKHKYLELLDNNTGRLHNEKTANCFIEDIGKVIYSSRIKIRSTPILNQA